jgi:hypothetical protein
MSLTIIHSADIKEHLKNELSSTKENITVISAYVKLEALKWIDSFISSDVISKSLLVRFRMGDILFGSTDIEIYDYCHQNKWDIYVNFDLHSKIFTFDQSKFLLGSANVTLSGLGIGTKANLESMASGLLSSMENQKIQNFFNQSTKLTPAIMQEMMTQFKTIEIDKPSESVEWNTSIMSQFNNDSTLLWVSEMLFSETPYSIDLGDAELLGLDRIPSELLSIEMVREKFMISKVYKWLYNVVKRKEVIYFGELSAELHNSLINDPRPYRKDVKHLLNNLLNWVIELRTNDLIIDQPNRSKRIRYIGG